MTESSTVVLDRETVIACECSRHKPGAVLFITRRPYTRQVEKIWCDPALLPKFAKLGPGVVKP